MKKIPMRKCVVTQERLPKKELVRIVRTTNHTVEVDLTGKLNGRGAYLQKKKEKWRTGMGRAGPAFTETDPDADKFLLLFPEFCL